MIFKLHDAFRNRKVLLRATLAHNKEAAGLLVSRVRADLEVRKVSHLCLAALMETNDLFAEGLIVAFKAVTVFLEIQDSSALGLDLVDVKVVDAGDFVASLSALHRLTLVEVSGLGGLLSLT